MYKANDLNRFTIADSVRACGGKLFNEEGIHAYTLTPARLRNCQATWLKRSALTGKTELGK